MSSFIRILDADGQPMIINLKDVDKVEVTPLNAKAANDEGEPLRVGSVITRRNSKGEVIDEFFAQTTVEDIWDKIKAKV